jgi:serine/threonine protein kinase
LKGGGANCGALAAAHGRGILHRDLKTEDVMVTALSAKCSISAKSLRLDNEVTQTISGESVGTAA